MKIDIPDEVINDIIQEELLWYLHNADGLTEEDTKAFERVLAHYMIHKDYNNTFGAGTWEKLMGLED
jgi:16S rRNA C1402 (ribose-2'-O) methylase RsmI